MTWKELPAHMDGAAVYLDTVDNRLLFVFQTETTPEMREEKVAVAVNYTQKIRPSGKKGKREKQLGNYIRTGGYVDIGNINEGERYVRLK